MWFLAEGDQVAMSLNTRRQKVKNLRPSRPARCSSSTCRTPTATWRSAGTAVVTPDDDRAFAEKVGAKYNADLREHDAPGDRRVVVRIVPVRVNAVDMSG